LGDNQSNDFNNFPNSVQTSSNIDDGLLPFSEQENNSLLDNLNKLKLGVERNTFGGPEQQLAPPSFSSFQ
jgi:hypothetical protein